MGIYLDYNASTPLDQRVLDVMVDVYQNKYGNADSRTHDFGETARSIVESSRKQVAELLAINKDEVFFTSGATESNNITILGLQEFAEKTSKKHIITTSIEHKAVLEPLHQLEKRGFEVTYIDPDSSGRINADELLSKVRNDTLLVSVMHANNETGIIRPIDTVGESLCETDIFFHIDTAQSFGKLVDELKSVKYNFLSASAHKMYVSFNGVNSEALMLATRQFCAVSNGSACNSSNYKPSYVLSAMGLNLERIESAIRISWGIDNTGLDNFTNMLYTEKTII